MARTATAPASGRKIVRLSMGYPVVRGEQEGQSDQRGKADRGDGVITVQRAGLGPRHAPPRWHPDPASRGRARRRPRAGRSTPRPPPNAKRSFGQPRVPPGDGIRLQGSGKDGASGWASAAALRASIPAMTVASARAPVPTASAGRRASIRSMPRPERDRAASGGVQPGRAARPNPPPPRLRDPGSAARRSRRCSSSAAPRPASRRGQGGQGMAPLQTPAAARGPAPRSRRAPPVAGSAPRRSARRRRARRPGALAGQPSSSARRAASLRVRPAKAADPGAGGVERGQRGGQDQQPIGRSRCAPPPATARRPWRRTRRPAARAASDSAASPAKGGAGRQPSGEATHLLQPAQALVQAARPATMNRAALNAAWLTRWLTAAAPPVAPIAAKT